MLSSWPFAYFINLDQLMRYVRTSVSFSLSSWLKERFPVFRESPLDRYRAFQEKEDTLSAKVCHYANAIALVERTVSKKVYHYADVIAEVRSVLSRSSVTICKCGFGSRRNGTSSLQWKRCDATLSFGQRKGARCLWQTSKMRESVFHYHQVPGTRYICCGLFCHLDVKFKELAAQFERYRGIS
jgi:hypothetical protein